MSTSHLYLSDTVDLSLRTMTVLSALLSLFLLTPAHCRRIFPEGAHLLPDFDLSLLEVQEEYKRPVAGCLDPEVRETVTLLKYDWRDSQDTLHLAILVYVATVEHVQGGEEKKSL